MFLNFRDLVSSVTKMYLEDIIKILCYSPFQTLFLPQGSAVRTGAVHQRGGRAGGRAEK